VRRAPPLIALAFYAATAAGYGVFRDELYYSPAPASRLGLCRSSPDDRGARGARPRRFGDSGSPPLAVGRRRGGHVLLVGDTARSWWRPMGAAPGAAPLATAPIYLALFSIFR
jgi:hypothetical protein